MHVNAGGIAVCKKCHGTCVKCRRPIPQEERRKNGFFCQSCVGGAKDEARAAYPCDPHVHTAIDFSDRSRRALHSPITGHPYRQRVYLESSDDDNES
jgi:hypothetical protein